MNQLDAVDQIRAVDSHGMYDKIYRFPEQIDEAITIGRKIEPDPDFFSGIKGIVLAGMGGSAIGGDLARSYLRHQLKIPFEICRNYRLPASVDKDYLVIASSYSGWTEETLAALDDALARGARIACLTTGGRLGKIADQKGFLKVILPTGYQPRAALGFSFIPLLFFLEKTGLIKNVTSEIAALAPGLKKYREQYDLAVGTDNNPAKSLALRLQGKIPVIYTGPELTDIVGLRWKGQICENAKMLAFNNQFSEFNHNELVGWNEYNVSPDRLAVVILRDSDDAAPIKKRIPIVREMIEKRGIEVIDIYSQGDFPLGRIFSLIQLGDFTSFYLAILNNVDPTPIEAIDYLKEKLAE